MSGSHRYCTHKETESRKKHQITFPRTFPFKEAFIQGHLQGNREHLTCLIMDARVLELQSKTLTECKLTFLATPNCSPALVHNQMKG